MSKSHKRENVIIFQHDILIYIYLVYIAPFDNPAAQISGQWDNSGSSSMCQSYCHTRVKIDRERERERESVCVFERESKRVEEREVDR